MSVLKSVLQHDVFPATGCTEPIAIAYAASLAADQLNGDICSVDIYVDPGVYKNGFAVTVPNTQGRRGNLIAGVLGALIQTPALKMEILGEICEEDLLKAEQMIKEKKAKITCLEEKQVLYIDVEVKTQSQKARAVIEGGHTNLVKLSVDDKPVWQNLKKLNSMNSDQLKKTLRGMTFKDLIKSAENLDKEDYLYLKKGVDMNLKISEAGRSLNKVSFYIAQLVADKNSQDDVFSTCEILTTAAVDARIRGG